MHGIVLMIIMHACIQVHNKEYKEDLEELRRHTIWQANKKFIDSHNSVAGNFGYSLEVNHFGDLTDVEFGQIYNGYKKQEPFNSYKLLTPYPNFKPADSVDWRDRG